MADEEEVEEGGGEEEGGGGGSKKLIIIGLVVALLAAGAAAFFMMSGGEEEEEEQEVQVSSAAEPLANPIFLDLGTFIANLKEGRRYLKAKIQLMISEEMAAAYLTVRLVEMKDIVLSELQEVSVEDVKKPEHKDELKQKLITKISRLFPSKPEWEDQEPIKKVLFEEFYVQ